ncbi:hypothetical protein ACWIG4_30445 [Streptomyces sp. NPDC002248]
MSAQDAEQLIQVDNNALIDRYRKITDDLQHRNMLLELALEDAVKRLQDLQAQLAERNSPVRAAAPSD